MSRLDRIEASILALTAKMDMLIQESGVDVTSPLYAPSEVREKPTKAYIEVRGKPGHEEVWYCSNKGKMVKAKRSAQASAKVGYTIAYVPLEAKCPWLPPLVDGAMNPVPLSIVIEKRGKALIRVRGKKVEYMRRGKWVAGIPAYGKLDGRKIDSGKAIVPKHHKDGGKGFVVWSKAQDEGWEEVASVKTKAEALKKVRESTSGAQGLTFMYRVTKNGREVCSLEVSDIVSLARSNYVP